VDEVSREFDQGRRDFQEARHKHGSGIPGMVVGTSHRPGHWLYEYQEPRGVDWCVTLVSVWHSDDDLKAELWLQVPLISS